MPERDLRTHGAPERELMRDFLLWSREALDELVTQQRFRRAFIESLHGFLLDVWVPNSRLFDLAAERVPAISDRQIEEFGLNGFQLQMKLEVVAYWWSQVLRVPRVLEPVIRRFLEAMDTLLESILGAIPMGDALVELKDTIKNTLKELNDVP